MFRKSTLIAALLATGLLMGGALSSMADARSDCERRAREAADKANRYAQQHGMKSDESVRLRDDANRKRLACQK